MTKCRIIYDNLWRQGTIIAYSSQDPQFPALNTQDDDSSIVWRTTTVAGTTTLDLDIGSARSYQFIALLNHNLTAGATITLYGADNSAFNSGLVSDVITRYGNDLFAFLPALRTKRYIRISIQDTGNSSGYLQIGTIVVAPYFQPERSFGKRAHGRADDTEQEKTPGGNRFVTVSKPKPQVISLPFTGSTGADWATFMDLYEKCGTEFAFIVCMDYNSPNTNSFWLILVSMDPPENSAWDYWTLVLNCEEHV